MMLVSCARKALMVWMLCLLSLSLTAQHYGNNHPFDFKKFNLGFLMGFNYNSYNLKEQVNIVEDGVLLKQITAIGRPGLNLGMISNVNLSKRVSLRLVPAISLEERNFEYRFQGRAQDSLIMRKIEAAYMNFPLMFQFKTSYYKATRLYVLGGAQIGFNLASNKRVLDDQDLLKIDNQDISLVFGFGFNLYGERIKLSPEIKYTLGLLDIYRPEYTSHAQAIRRLTSQVLSINVNFE